MSLLLGLLRSHQAGTHVPKLNATEIQRSRAFKAPYRVHQPRRKHNEGAAGSDAGTAEPGGQAVFHAHAQGWVVGRRHHPARVQEFQIPAHGRVAPLRKIMSGLPTAGIAALCTLGVACNALGNQGFELNIEPLRIRDLDTGQRAWKQPPDVYELWIQRLMAGLHWGLPRFASS